jgi:hypothetical protein
LMTRETVVVPTPAAFATSRNVARRFLACFILQISDCWTES